MAALIQSERNRRLGVREDGDASNKHHPLPRSISDTGELSGAAPPNSGGGVLGNIRGWFGGGGAANANNQSAPLQKPPMPSPSRRASAPVIKGLNNMSNHNVSSHEQRRSSDYQMPPASDFSKNASYNEDDENSSSSSSDYSSSDEDSDSASQSSASYEGDAALTPQERARSRALRYLSNSCVDASRKAKTASYVRGLERLDLKRKRDRIEKELDIVEAEMNKDRGLNNGGEKDAISVMAAKLVCELPRIQGADAGAGSSGGKDFMSFEEYASAVSTHNADFHDGNQQQPSPWENKEAVDLYIGSLQSRLKESQDRTRSLDKRLVVLEQAGDDIVSSLCEDLADVTGHSNKAEARYVKKGKELQRKRRREELRHRSKIKQAERRIRKLEEKLMVVSGVRKMEEQLLMESENFFEASDSSNGDSRSNAADDAEDDEVFLEKKLSAIQAKNKEDKDQHYSEMGSIRRQCEQLKLRLSVTRLVMEGDDNLREYIALLERLNPNTRQQRKQSALDITSDDFDGHEFPEMHGDAIPPPPPRITRARAKLLKVSHLAHIYEQRLSVSKAFTDATINALDQELCERESASQKMEVRCLNELVMIDSGIKDIVKEASDKLVDLESEAQELEDAIAACMAQQSIGSIGDMFEVNGASAESPKPAKDESFQLDDETSIDRSIEDNDDGILQTLVENETVFESKPWRRSVDDDSLSDTSLEFRNLQACKMSLGPQHHHLDDEGNGMQQLETDLQMEDNLSLIESESMGKSEHSMPATGESGQRIDESLSDRSIIEKDNNLHQLDSANSGWKHTGDRSITTENKSSSEVPTNKKVNGYHQEESASPPLVENDMIGIEPSQPMQEKENVSHHSETPDSSILENVAVDESESIPMDNDSSSKRSMVENGSALESAVESLHMGNAVSELSKPFDGEDISTVDVGNESVVKDERDKDKVETCHMSDNDLADNKTAGKSPLAESQRSRHLIVKAQHSDEMDVDCVEETSRKGTESAASGIGGFSRSNQASKIHDDDNYIGEFTIDSISPAGNKEVVKAMGDFDCVDGAKARPLGTLATDDIQFSDECKVPKKCIADANKVAEINDESPATKADDEMHDESCAPNSSPKSTEAHENIAVNDRSSKGEKNETVLAPVNSNTYEDLQLDHKVNEDSDENYLKKTKVDSRKKAVINMLGHELQCTLAEYQASFDLSSSSDRIKQLECMNDLVSKIAKVGGLECPNNDSGELKRMKSWSLKKSHRKTSEKERYEKKHSKEKKKKKKKRRRGKERKEKQKDEQSDPSNAHDQSLVW